MSRCTRPACPPGHALLVTPAKAGVQACGWRTCAARLDAGLRRHDGWSACFVVDKVRRAPAFAGMTAGGMA
ncbi:MAG TPA: hypothetical protein VMU82_17300 [Acetobacteraceae bacterium]|nr:hypothetical protein [Acetobacteraceae bacterium]